MQGSLGSPGRFFLFCLIVGATACHGRLEPLPVFTLTLGWRFIPDTELKYRLTTRFFRGEDVVERSEIWSYLVTEADTTGRFLLSGHLRDLNAAMTWHRESVATGLVAPASIRELIRGRIQGFQLTLTRDGRIPWTDGGSWSDTLPHHLLALRLPDHAVTLGDRWDDADAARPFRGLFPFESEDGEVGTQQLRAIQWAWTGQPDTEAWRVDTTNLLAIVETRAAIQAPDSVSAVLHIQGQATWNVSQGLMEHRLLEIRDQGSASMDERSFFSMELQRMAE